MLAGRSECQPLPELCIPTFPCSFLTALHCFNRSWFTSSSWLLLPRTAGHWLETLAFVLFSALLRRGVTYLEGPSQATVPRSSVFTIPLHHIGVEEVKCKTPHPATFLPSFEVTKSDVKVGSCGKKHVRVKQRPKILFDSFPHVLGTSCNFDLRPNFQKSG